MRTREKSLTLSWLATKGSRRITWKIIAFTLLTAGGVLFIVPFIWMVSASLKTRPQIFQFPVQWIPNPIDWTNYPEGLAFMGFLNCFRNSCIVTFGSVAGQLLSSAMVAYGFARLRFRGRGILFVILLATMMLPYPVTMIPKFMIFRSLGWIDTFAPLIVPTFFGAGLSGAFYIFLLRQFFMTIPLELDDAAKIDGCSYWGIFWRIILPQTRAALGAIAIFSFMWNWMDFLGPLIYLNSLDNFTISLGLNQLVGYRYTQWGWMMAASVVAITPPVILFFVSQKYFIRGIVVTGVKG